MLAFYDLDVLDLVHDFIWLGHIIVLFVRVWLQGLK